MPIYFRLGYDDALWAAPRIGRADHYQPKHIPKALKGELAVETNPAYFQLQEHYDIWTRKIEDLYVQQAYVKFTRNVPHILRHFMKPTKTIKIKIMNVPKPTCTLEHITKIKDFYSSWLMKPVVGDINATHKQEVVPALNAPTRPRRI